MKTKIIDYRARNNLKVLKEITIPPKIRKKWNFSIMSNGGLLIKPRKKGEPIITPNVVLVDKKFKKKIKKTKEKIDKNSYHHL